MLLEIRPSQLQTIDLKNISCNVFIAANFSTSNNEYEELFYAKTLEFFNSLAESNAIFSTKFVFEKDSTIDDVIEEFSTPSLFEGNKIIFVREFSQDSKKEFLEKLNILVNIKTDDTYVIIFDTNGTFKPIYNYVNKIDISPYQSANDYILYLVNYAQENGYRLNNATASYLFAKTNKNLKVAVTELEKIFLYDLGYKDITNDDIDLISIDVLENEIYDIANALSKKDNNDAFRILSRCLRRGVKEDSFFSQICNQYHLMFDVSLSSETNSDIAKKLSVHEYPVKLARVASKNYKPLQLKTIVEKLDQIMFSLHQGKINASTALQLAVCFIMVN